VGRIDALDHLLLVRRRRVDDREAAFDSAWVVKVALAPKETVALQVRYVTET
jgi:hypothetical protein